MFKKYCTAQKQKYEKNISTKYRTEMKLPHGFQRLLHNTTNTGLECRTENRPSSRNWISECSNPCVHSPSQFPTSVIWGVVVLQTPQKSNRHIRGFMDSEDIPVYPRNPLISMESMDVHWNPLMSKEHSLNSLISTGSMDTHRNEWVSIETTDIYGITWLRQNQLMCIHFNGYALIPMDIK